MDNRLDTLTRWVRQFPGLAQANPRPVAGDASFRRYFRVTLAQAGGESRSFIVMDAPPEHEDCRAFLALAHHWHAMGIAVPAIFRENVEQGFLLLEDFGDQLLLEALNDHNAERLYQGAMDELCRIQQLSEAPGYPLPPYDSELLDREMALFPDWLLSRQLGLELSNGERALLETTFAILRESALAQPEVAVHRDYHSRNLLVRPGSDQPGVIDFQDAVRGPVTYDLVSLLKDCYIRWPEERVCAWLEDYRQQSLALGLHRADADSFRQWFELMGMQRHLKAAGIFARLAIRDGKTAYLGDIPRTLGYLVEASGRQPALRNFNQWLLERVLPAVEKRTPATGAPAS